MNKSKNRNSKGELLTYQQTTEKSNIGINTVMKLARESGALIKIGRIARLTGMYFITILRQSTTQISTVV